MYFKLCCVYMDRNMVRHPRASGDPAYGSDLDSRLRGNDHRAQSPSVSATECITRSRCSPHCNLCPCQSSSCMRATLYQVPLTEPTV